MSDNKNVRKGSDAAGGKGKAVPAEKRKGELKVAAAGRNDVAKAGGGKGRGGRGTPAVASSPFDPVLWLFALALIAAAIGGNYYYTQFMMTDETALVRLGRVAAVIALIVAGLGVTLFTSKGRRLVAFGRDSYTELRKVVWPSRNESMQTTLIVFVSVCLVSIFLYLCDLVFLQIVRVITI